MNAIFQPIETLHDVGEKCAAALRKMGIETIYDLLYHIPRNYLDYTNPTPLPDTLDGESAVIRVKILDKHSPQYIRDNLTIYRMTATDGEEDIAIVLYNNFNVFDKFFHVGSWYRISGKIQKNFMEWEILASNYVTDKATLIHPVYPATAQLPSYLIERIMKQALKTFDNDPIDFLPQSTREKHGLLAFSEAIHQIHFPTSMEHMMMARRRLAFEELLVLYVGMLMQKKENSTKTSYQMKTSTSLEPFYNAIPFSLTAGQQQAISEITQDMCSSAPMNRLLQGDVGSGKTVVAAAACDFAIQNGVQCAVMAPTEILAQQHFQTFSQFLQPLGVRVGILTGSLRAKEKREVLKNIADGSTQLLIGTHAIFQKDVVFQNLGLVITDEQHRFGVEQRNLLAEKGENPHKLVMSATPIPRTLALMIYGELELSVLKELPKGRHPIKTCTVVNPADRPRTYQFIRNELKKGHQAYFVCPAIEETEMSAAMEWKAVKAYAESLQNGAFSDYHLGTLCGKMKGAEKDDIMLQFQRKEIDILVSTTVIEVGIDVPNATILLVENADRFGLSQLHQLRGRVGRGSAQSYCFFMADHHMNEEIYERLKIITGTNDGFEIAEADLRFRGPGDFLGHRQHGLPLLKVADLSKDNELLEEVQEEAASILKEDPTLSSEKFWGIHTEIGQLYGVSSGNRQN